MIPPYQRRKQNEREPLQPIDPDEEIFADIIEEMHDKHLDMDGTCWAAATHDAIVEYNRYVKELNDGN